MHERPTDPIPTDTCSQKVFGGLHNFNWKAHLAKPLGGGSFNLKFTHRNIIEDTRPIPYNASAALMQTILQELQELHMVHVTKSNKITYKYKHLAHMPYGEVGVEEDERPPAMQCRQTFFARMHHPSIHPSIHPSLQIIVAEQHDTVWAVTFRSYAGSDLFLMVATDLVGFAMGSLVTPV